MRVDSYLASKLIVLLLIGAAQVTLLFGIVRGVCEPPGPPLLQWLTLVQLMAAGTALGLLLSTTAGSEEVAAALVPVAVIPQIVLAGVTAPLSGFTLGLAKTVVTTYWGQQALERLLPPTERSQLTTDLGNGVLGTVLFAHAAVYMLLAYFLTCRRRIE